MIEKIDIEKAKEKIQILEEQYAEKQRLIDAKKQKLIKLTQEMKAKERALSNENRKVRNHRLIVLGVALENAIGREIDVSDGSEELIALHKYLDRYKSSIQQAVLNEGPNIIIEPFVEAP